MFEAAIVGGTNGVSADSIVLTTRSDYELGASGNLLVLHTVDNFGRDEREYHHEFGFIDNLGNRTLFVRDMLGSTRAVLKNGTMVEWNDYYAYGAARDSWSLVSGRWQYLGKEFDNETATLNLEAREYDPFVGFMQMDPFMHTPKLAGHSPYHYSFNNPFKFADKNGLLPIPLIPVAVIAAVEATQWVIGAAAVLWATNQVAQKINEVMQPESGAVTPPPPSGGFEGVAQGATLHIFPSAAADATTTRTTFPAADANLSQPVMQQATQIPQGVAGQVIVEDKGVKIYTHGTNDAHKPAHAHVEGKGDAVRIGTNGKPLKGQNELSGRQKEVVKENISKIRKILKKVGKENERIQNS